jgi:hypothetical protein
MNDIYLPKPLMENYSNIIRMDKLINENQNNLKY